MAIDQREAPLWEALTKHCREARAGFHVPGHRRGNAAPPELSGSREASLLNFDLTELPGLDDLHNPRGAIARAQALAARLYGARETFFLINGTTVGLQALIAASCGPGDTIILPRNGHRSMLGGLILSGADPVFLTPVPVAGFGFAAGISSDELNRTLAANPAAKAVLAVHPCYYGVVGDLAGQSRMIKEFGAPLLVDEAHGVHLSLHHGLPRGALACGADAAVQSTHKLGGSLTQTSWVHLGTELINRNRLASALAVLQTSSPSYILMASLDLARRQLALRGRDMMERLLNMARDLRKGISAVPGVELLGREHLGFDGAVDMDPGRLVISVRKWGLTGYGVQELLARRYRVYIEMADFYNLVVPVTIGTTAEECRALVSALGDIYARESGSPGEAAPDAPAPPRAPKRMTPREAWFAKGQAIPLGNAAGQISAGWVAVFPPGVPVLYPGEEVTPEVRDYLIWARDMGFNMQGLPDPDGKTIEIIAQ